MFPISKNYGFFMKNYLTNALNLKALLLNILGLLHRTTVNFISFGDAGEGGALKTCSAFHQKLPIVFAVDGCILLLHWHQSTGILPCVLFCRTRALVPFSMFLFPLTPKKCSWPNDNKATEQIVGTSSAFPGRDCSQRASVSGDFLGAVVRSQGPLVIHC